MYDPYHVYMDLDVMNNDYNATSKPQLRFEETRNTPFLPGDSADYFCSIVRYKYSNGQHSPCPYTWDSDMTECHKQNNLSYTIHH